jgi:hypothetical protein
MLQVRLEILATTYRSTMVKTHVFSLYSHLCIYVSMYLCIYIATNLHTIYLNGLQWCLRAIRGSHENDDQVNSEIHSEAVIQRLWTGTWRLRSSIVGDTLTGHDRVNLEMHSEIVIERLCRCNLEAMIVRTCTP